MVKLGQIKFVLNDPSSVANFQNFLHRQQFDGLKSHCSKNTPSGETRWPAYTNINRCQCGGNLLIKIDKSLL